MPGYISKKSVEQVRAAADLYDIVSADVTLKNSGAGSFVGLCPFHDEKTGSFHVRPSLGTWHCFGCGLGGDVFGYVEQKENVDFAQAVELLADRYHIELEYEDQGRGKTDRQRKGATRARLLEVCEQTQKFFASQLPTDDALPARKLLGGRNFTQSDCERFGCGYAPQGWDTLVRHLSSLGYTQEEMVEAGVARRGQNNSAYDYFRGRATWPIRDSTGRTVGFGARRLYDDDKIEAKYINTPDTALYHKDQVLYGIDIAKPNIVKKRQIVIVEGYTDVMACHLAGVDVAVATCGTAFGQEHAKIVRRFIRDDSLGAVQLVGPTHGSGVIFTFDGDAAGQKAALHAFGLDDAFLTQTFVAVARENLDPCDLRIKYGDEAVRNLIHDRVPLYDFVIQAAIRSFDTQFTTGLVGAMKAVAPVIAKIRDDSLLDSYTRKYAGQIGVSVGDLRREVLAERRRQRIASADAYVPRRSAYGTGSYENSFGYGGGAGSGPGGFESDRSSDSQPLDRRLFQEWANRKKAIDKGYYRVDDTVFSTEQQFFGILIQSPLALTGPMNAELFSRLTRRCFTTPVFRSMFDALEVAGGLPQSDTPQGLWIHELTKAAGPVLARVINELAVLPLPLSAKNRTSAGSNQTASSTGPGPSGRPQGPAPVQLAPATEAEVKFAHQLLVGILDADAMRAIAQLKRKMNRLPEGEEKIRLLGTMNTIETWRKDLTAQAYGNTNY